MSIVCLFALRNALDSARKDAGGTDDYFQMSEYSKIILPFSLLFHFIF
jgi:hypothetical protein